VAAFYIALAHGFLKIYSNVLQNDNFSGQVPMTGKKFF
jgi:hypothetical protein